MPTDIIYAFPRWEYSRTLTETYNSRPIRGYLRVLCGNLCAWTTLYDARPLKTTNVQLSRCPSSEVLYTHVPSCKINAKTPSSHQNPHLDISMTMRHGLVFLVKERSEVHLLVMLRLPS